jgi:2-C-methyl-D-erythritol 4-phosphate cytidylyltransferase
MNGKTYIILVAGGKGTRMGSETPKQFHEVAGKPLVMHTFDAFSAYYDKARFLLVLPEMEIGLWKHLCVDYDFSVPHQIVEGGPTRYHSVKNALVFVEDRSLVFVHDAVRPLVSRETIKSCQQVATIHGTAIPVTPVIDSLRTVENGTHRSVDRSRYRKVQTPQVFSSEILKKAYRQAYRERFTDDASVVESSGEMLHLVEGNPDNIKVTRPGDLGYVEWVLALNNHD